jgi:hypothetical protein
MDWQLKLGPDLLRIPVSYICCVSSNATQQNFESRLVAYQPVQRDKISPLCASDASCWAPLSAALRWLYLGWRDFCCPVLRETTVRVPFLGFHLLQVGHRYVVWEPCQRVWIWKGVMSLGRATRFSPQGLTGLAPTKRGFLKRETSWNTARH